MSLFFCECRKIVVFKVLVSVRHDILPEFACFGVTPYSHTHSLTSFNGTVESFTQNRYVQVNLKELTCADIDDFMRGAELESVHMHHLCGGERIAFMLDTAYDFFHKKASFIKIVFDLNFQDYFNIMFFNCQ